MLVQGEADPAAIRLAAGRRRFGICILGDSGSDDPADLARQGPPPS